MKLLKSQRGHFHIGLLLLAIIGIIGVIGFTVMSKQQSSHLSSVTQGATKAVAQVAPGPWPPKTCDDLDLLSDEQYEQVTDAMFDSLCGLEDDEGDPELTVDPCVQGLAPYTDEQIAAMTDEQYNALCPPDATAFDDSEEIDGGTGTDEDEEIETTTTTTTPSGKKVKTKKKVTISLASKAVCVNTASQVPLKQLRTYGSDRIKTRQKALASENKKLDRQYNKARITNALKHKQDNANRRVQIVAKQTKKKATAVKVAVPASHRSQLKKEISTANKILKQSVSAIKKSKTSAQAAGPVCNAIFDSRVYTYVVPKIHAQKNVDSLYIRNAAYNIDYQANLKIAKMRKKTTTAKPVTPAAIKSSLNGLQAKLNNINKQSVDNHVAAGNKANSLFLGTLQADSQNVLNTIRAGHNQVKIK